MHSLVVVTFCCLVAMALAGSEYYGDGYNGRGYESGYYGGNSGRKDGYYGGYGGYYGDYRGRKDGYYGGYGGYGYGFTRTDRGIEAVYNNAARQQRVNQIAEHVDAGTGTAYRYGVPGTGNYFSNDRYGYNRGYSGY